MVEYRGRAEPSRAAACGATTLSCTGGAHRSKKIVMLLVDALREDFVEFDDSSEHLIDMEASTYKGQRI